MEARRWLDGITFPPDRPLINVSQAAPVDPPPQALRAAIAELVLTNDEAHLYGPVLGLPELRAELAMQCGVHYGAGISADHVAITSGCNQAFAATLSAITGQGDEVIIPTPWYFNHKMWLDMMGIGAIALPTGPDLLPDPDQARSLITPRTRAIALVTPNNPGGVEYPAELVMAFYQLAQANGLKLILDETYRDFDSRTAPKGHKAKTGTPHSLFSDPDWSQTLIHLYSFSKAYRLTGHRVGAMITAPALLAEAEKFLDTVAICPNQIGQHAALWGMQNLSTWLAEQRAEILDRRAAIELGFPTLENRGWKLMGAGAYFAYMQHPFDMDSDAVAQALVREAGVLLLPGTMFTPQDDKAGKRQLRVAFANLDRAGIKSMFNRLENLPF
ncbi:MAG: aminotransferase [Rhodobacteraceae bacterium]|nr:aminotransferase [Paracoccaceae bacterium]